MGLQPAKFFETVLKLVQIWDLQGLSFLAGIFYDRESFFLFVVFWFVNVLLLPLANKVLKVNADEPILRAQCLI